MELLRWGVLRLKRHWKKIAAALAALLLAAGGLLFWRVASSREGGARQSAPAPYAFPAPDPVAFEPAPEDAPPVRGYAPSPEAFARDEATGARFVKNIVVLYFERGATQAQKQAALEAVGGQAAGQADMIGKWEVRVDGETLEAIDALCGQLEALPGVAAATPDHVIELAPQAMPGDPWVGAGYEDAAANRRWAEAVRLPEAWDYNAAVPAQVAVGMVDTGTNAGHEELSGVVSAVTRVGGAGYPQAPTDHGAGVAGVLAARANNGRGLAGVLWNAKVYAADVMNPRGANGSLQMVYDAIAEELRLGAKAVNMSLGVMGSSSNPDGLEDADVALSARDSALFLSRLLANGYGNFVIIQSAGNSAGGDAIRNGLFASVTPENCQLEPAMAQMVCSRILIVGALRETGGGCALAEFSAAGSQVSLCAPGDGLFLPASASSAAYQVARGTSFSAPQVAAVAAWMLAANPALDGGQVGQLLKTDAVSPLAVRPGGGGAPAYRMLDCKRALDAALNDPRLAALSGCTFVVMDDTRVVKNIPLKTTAGDFLPQVSTMGGAAVYAKAQGTPARFIGTGDQVTVTAPGGAQAIYTLAVRGDLNGDGRADALDAQLLRRRLAGRWAPAYGEAAFLAAADWDGDGLADGADADAMFAQGLE